MRRIQAIAAAAVLAAAIGATQPARAGTWEDAGWGALATVSNLAYMPAKLVYATFGALTGGLAYGLTGGSFDTAEAIWAPSVGGTYVLTPRMLQGQDAIAFAGSRENEATAAAADDEAAPHDAEQIGRGGLHEQHLGGS